MAYFHPAWLEHQRRRYTRPDARRWMKPAPYVAKSLSDQPRALENHDIEPSADEIEAYRSALIALRGAIAEIRRDLLTGKARFNPFQPRVPAGNPDGGQWTGEGDGFAPDARVWLASGQKPEVPKQRPPTAQERNRIGRGLARGGPLGLAIEILGGASWLRELRGTYDSYFDPPKSLEELQQAASEPRSGYDIHHIVEQSSAASDGYPRDMIDAPENRVSIPRWKHWEINGWYETPNKDYGGETPRSYLRGKSWDERIQVGHDALKKYGVLSP
jgi:hypothetical protein